MINDKSVVTTGHGVVSCVSSVSWGAVFAGALVGIGLNFLLNLFSIAIGLSVYTTTQTGATSIAIGGLMGMVIGLIISMFVGGFASGYLGRAYCAERNLGILYGFTTWCLALLMTVFITTQIGEYVASYTRFIANPTMVVVASPEKATEKKVDSAKTVVSKAAAIAKANQNREMAGLEALLIFVLFATGALFSALGGHCGMTCHEHEKH